MNPNNTCTLEASRRLMAAEVVLETDLYWDRVPIRLDDWGGDKHYVLSTKGSLLSKGIPAPSMSELWRELPESIQINTHTWKHLTTEKMGPRMEAYYRPCDKSEIKSSENPCDALADLLIWVRGREYELER